MKKNSKHEPLDEYEKDLMEAIARDELIEVKNQKKEIRKMQSYVRDMPRKDKRITIRVNEEDLTHIQNKAIKSGIPYQTLIAALLHQYATGDVSIEM